MASIKEARSIELDRIVDPELAYDLFWADQISDKTQFACLGEGCGAQTTCANIDRPRHEMKQSPHFRVIGNHVSGCEVVEALFSSVSSELASGGGGSRARSFKNPDLPDVFRLRRPENHLVKAKIESDDPKAGARAKAKRKRSGQSSTRKAGHSTHYSIGPLISKFIRYREEGVTQDRFVKIGTRELSYKDLFVGVYHQDLENLPSTPRIYWGMTFMGRNLKDNGFRIGFADYFVSDGNDIKPSIPISDSKLASYPVNKPLKKVLERKSKEPLAKDRRCFVFVYSKPELNEYRGKLYINFKFSSLDYIETRGLWFYDEIKKKP